jgi:hypothetical protein
MGQLNGSCTAPTAYATVRMPSSADAVAAKARGSKPHATQSRGSMAPLRSGTRCEFENPNFETKNQISCLKG